MQSESPEAKAAIEYRNAVDEGKTLGVTVRVTEYDDKPFRVGFDVDKGFGVYTLAELTAFLRGYGIGKGIYK